MQSDFLFWLYYIIWLCAWCILRYRYHTKVFIPLHNIIDENTSKMKVVKQMLSLIKWYKGLLILGTIGWCSYILFIMGILFSWVTIQTSIVNVFITLTIWLGMLIFTYRMSKIKFNIVKTYDLPAYRLNDTDYLNTISIEILDIVVLKYHVRLKQYVSELSDTESGIIDMFKAIILCRVLNCPEKIYTQFMEEVEKYTIGKK